MAQSTHSSQYPLITKPATGVAAFAGVHELLAAPQAAILLSLGRQLRQDESKTMAAARAVRRGKTVEFAPEADTEFPVPSLVKARRLKTAEVATRLKSRYAFGGRRGASYETAYSQCADDLYRTGSAETAGDLMQMCLGHPKPLVRIAAAFSYLPMTDNREACIAELVKGVRSKDELERDVAATALARVNPRHPALERLSRGRTAKRGRKPAHTLTLVHGTWASDSEWYKPGGTFYSFVQAARPDIYAGGDFFQWSGGYSDGAREQGAKDLVKWVADHKEQGLDLMGHSHGANVALRAGHLGMRCGKLILLSCPVHVSKYFPNFSQLTKPVYSVRVKMDLVILADGGGQRFNHADIKEIVLPIWFNHSASHDPAVWRDHQVAQRVAL